MHYISCPFAYNMSNYLDDYFFQINKEMLMYIYIYIYLFIIYTCMIFQRDHYMCWAVK